MRIFGYVILKQEEYERLKVQDQIALGLYNYAYWFSGFRETFTLLKRFANREVNSVTIDSIRQEYAYSLGKTIYGEQSATEEGK